jgi:hypothetical protein
MPNLSKTTKDHEEIRRWAEERGGKPAHVKSTGSGEDIGILRIDFPGYSGAGSLESITWEQWFEKFDERNLALLYQEETAGGQRSNFNKIVSAETAQEAENGRGRSRSAGSRSRAKKASVSKKSGSAAASKKSRSGGTSARKGASASTSTRSGRQAKKATKGGASRRAGSKTSSAKKTSSRRATSKKSTGKKTATKKRR